MQVIYFVDPLDEYVMQHLTEYEDKVFQDASKDSLKILGKEGKVKMKKAAKMYKKLTRWWKDLLAGESIGFVKVIIPYHNHLRLIQGTVVRGGYVVAVPYTIQLRGCHLVVLWN